LVNMINPRQNELFDTFKEFLSPLAYKTLVSGWQGVFRHVILETLPAPEIANHFNKVFGRPTKELYSIAGILLIKEFMDWTEEEAANAYMFNADIQYALNLGRDKISMSARTIQRYERIFRENDCASGIMTEVTNKLISELDLDISKQRLDSTHIFSDMTTFARTRLMGIAIKRFLTQLKRHNREGYDSLPENVRNRYRKSQGGLFGEVTSDKESRSMLRQEVAEEMYFLITTFSGVKDVENRTTYKDLVTIFHQQCSLVELSQKIHEESGSVAGSKNNHDSIEPPSPKPNDGEIEESSQAKNNGEKTLCDSEKTPSPLVSDKEESPGKTKVEVKKNTGGRVIQNSSDPDATYSGHKGVGYQAQIAETCSGANEVQLITYALPETACEPDPAAVAPTMDKLEKENLLPDKMLADTHYGSDENVLDCKNRGVELISPASGNPPKEPPKNPSEKQQRLATRREQEKTEDWREEYKIRAGIEATNSGLKRKTGLGQLRVRGKKSVFNVILLKIAGWNILRAASSAKMKEKIAKIVEKSNQTKKRMRDLNVFGLNSSSQPHFPALYQLIAA
jgi:hypothetical protein